MVSFIPGILLTIFFTAFTSAFYDKGIPPQLILLLGIPIIIIPALYVHLLIAKRAEQKQTISELIPYKEKLPTAKLIGYTLGLIVFAFDISFMATSNLPHPDYRADAHDLFNVENKKHKTGHLYPLRIELGRHTFIICNDK